MSARVPPDMIRPRIAILASGGGTTAEAFIRAGQRGDINVDVGLIIVSRKNAGIFERIESLNKELGLDIRCILINQITQPVSQPLPQPSARRHQRFRYERLDG